MGFLPCGVYHEKYSRQHAWWQTNFVRGKMIFLLILLLVILPEFAGNYWLSVATLVGYTILSAMGVQLLIGYCGQVTLGHSAFIAVGAYTSAILMLQYEVPYLLSLVAAGVVAGGWSVLFGLPSARVKGF